MIRKVIGGTTQDAQNQQVLGSLNIKERAIAGQLVMNTGAQATKFAIQQSDDGGSSWKYVLGPITVAPGAVVQIDGLVIAERLQDTDAPEDKRQWRVIAEGQANAGEAGAFLQVDKEEVSVL